MREIMNILSVALPMMALFILFRLFFRAVRQPKRIISESNGMKKISGNPSIFRGASQKVYYYDSKYLYEVKNDVTSKIPLSEIIQIKPGYTQINNRRNWLVSYLKHGEKKHVEFFNNLTIFNHNFSGFLSAVKQANPEAEIKALTFFNL
ncbi:hypothetical protein [Atlantibacter hermannii]|uniref:hypothetical protein n=1 Tax=Atlantibacter hermannii TaxID=565 RepID=UPI0034D6C60F